MVENSNEEYIENAEHFINSIKTDKEYKEENGWHGYYNKEIVELARILEHILQEYKRVLKENEELKKENEELHKEIERMKSLDIYKLVEDWETGQLIPIQKIKAKIEELYISISTCEYADDDSEEYKQEVEKDKTELLIAKKVLQQLLGSDK